MVSASGEPPGPGLMWDARYGQAGLLFGDRPNAFLEREAARLAPGSRVLCVADGEGRNSLYLAALGHAVTAFDASPVAVAKARDWAARRGLVVDFHVSEAGAWPWTPQAFDAVAAIFVQFAPPGPREAMFAGMWRTLRPGGLLLIQGYTPRQLEYRTGGPDKADQLYTKALMPRLVPEADWLVLSEYEAVLEEGTAHRGQSALLGAVARKPAA